MRIAQPSKILAYLPVYIAIEGKNHEMFTYDDPLESIRAAVKGEVEMSMGDPFLFDYIDYNEENIVIFAGFIKRVFHSLITFNPFVKTADKKELEGKTIVSYPEPSTSFFLSRRLKQQLKFGNIIQTPFNTELGPLLTQEADAAIVLEPNTTYAIRNGARELLDFSKQEMVMTGFCTTLPYYRKHLKELKKFLEEVKIGIELFENDEETTLRVAKKYFPLVEELILTESIEKLRNAKIYCKDFKFNDNEIKEGIKMRDISIPYAQVKKYIFD
ncbi:MAG: hypothetical protein Q7S22_02470 [Candidatus Micrarchaeota archaeon]|nr:hypothetical protein [Candidatus Micrarchaeota archaeon]